MSPPRASVPHAGNSSRDQYAHDSITKDRPRSLNLYLSLAREIEGPSARVSLASQKSLEKSRSRIATCLSVRDTRAPSKQFLSPSVCGLSNYGRHFDSGLAERAACLPSAREVFQRVPRAWRDSLPPGTPTPVRERVPFFPSPSRQSEKRGKKHALFDRRGNRFDPTLWPPTTTKLHPLLPR